MKEKTLSQLYFEWKRKCNVFFPFQVPSFFGTASASNLYFKHNLPRFCFCSKLYLSFRFDENWSAITTSPTLTWTHVPDDEKTRWPSSIKFRSRSVVSFGHWERMDIRYPSTLNSYMWHACESRTRSITICLPEAWNYVVPWIDVSCGLWRSAGLQPVQLPTQPCVSL